MQARNGLLPPGLGLTVWLTHRDRPAEMPVGIVAQAQAAPAWGTLGILQLS